MKRTTISWSKAIAEAVEREARRRRVSVSEVVREIIDEHFGVTSCRPREIPFAAVGASRTGDISERFDEILAREWADAIDNDRDR